MSVEEDASPDSFEAMDFAPADAPEQESDDDDGRPEFLPLEMEAEGDGDTEEEKQARMQAELDDFVRQAWKISKLLLGVAALIAGAMYVKYLTTTASAKAADDAFFAARALPKGPFHAQTAAASVFGSIGATPKVHATPLADHGRDRGSPNSTRAVKLLARRPSVQTQYFKARVTKLAAMAPDLAPRAANLKLAAMAPDLTIGGAKAKLAAMAPDLTLGGANFKLAAMAPDLTLGGANFKLAAMAPDLELGAANFKLAAMAPDLAPRAAKDKLAAMDKAKLAPVTANAMLATMPPNSLDDGLSVATALAKEIRLGVKLPH
jgi:hypothetical protein